MSLVSLLVFFWNVSGFTYKSDNGSRIPVNMCWSHNKSPVWPGCAASTATPSSSLHTPWASMSPQSPAVNTLPTARRRWSQRCTLWAPGRRGRATARRCVAWRPYLQSFRPAPVWGLVFVLYIQEESRRCRHLTQHDWPKRQRCRSMDHRCCPPDWSTTSPQPTTSQHLSILYVCYLSQTDSDLRLLELEPLVIRKYCPVPLCSPW